ncbi:serine/threonine-protein kinase [Mycolicibacterium arenosum]|uniref:non-specific serine/threonine protein kinase n=1 Tax=Mycolicibacterium arenosum TaxID=2952157 RepID=A0ABT1M3X5_9MYCO|nr:serine/threonine-protein kinase [Mycolicibacterium sp. CAU 1645]MCP9273560.1 serine/threonine-protein kinase [Mycolicibacterium sp. CAU 1645]
MADLSEEGAPFGRYRLIAPLGKGGMGQVFRAYDTETDRVVAVKVLPPQLALDAKFKERFRREAHAAARLSEPHVVPIHHYGEIDGQLYVDMRLIEGEDLGQILRRTHHFGIEQKRAVTLVGQVAEALHAAHRAGLVHRDVKPSNILVTDTDFAYLIDFGIVRASEEETLTASGMTMGTVSYMAPEQFTSGVADVRSDVYALTCVLFEALTGRVPFPGDLKKKSSAHVNDPPPQPSRERRGVTPALDAVIARGMAKDPDRRYQSTIELADAARAALRAPVPESTETLRPAPLPPAPPTRPAPIQPRLDAQRTDHLPPRVPQRGPAAPHVPYYPMRPPRPPWWQSRAAALVVVLIAVIAVVVAVIVVATSGSSDDDDRRVDSPRTGQAGPSVPLQSGRQTTLPFDYGTLMNVAVGPDNTVYVGSILAYFELPERATTPTAVRLADDTSPTAMSVYDDMLYMLNLDGTVRVIAPGANRGTTLPFETMKQPGGMAVDGDGTVYVTDTINDRILMLEDGASESVEMRVEGLSRPGAMAADPAGNLYVMQQTGIVRVAAGAEEATAVEGGPPATNIACDRAGNLYVVDGLAGSVTRLTVATGEWDELPFENLESPYNIAVGDDGSVYVVDKLESLIRLEAE